MSLRNFLQLKTPETLQRCIAHMRDKSHWGSYQHLPIGPPPHFIKSNTVLEYAHRNHIDVLVETGTFRGDMVAACASTFRKIYTIELDSELYKRAKQRFQAYPSVTVLHGDSTVRLQALLPSLASRALFWLDGHYSGGRTARGDRDTPLLAELKAILDHPIKNHILLIDDARLLGTGDYPSFSEIRLAIQKINSSYNLSISHDILRCDFFPDDF